MSSFDRRVDIYCCPTVSEALYSTVKVWVTKFLMSFLSNIPVLPITIEAISSLPIVIDFLPFFIASNVFFYCFNYSFIIVFDVFYNILS